MNKKTTWKNNNLLLKENTSLKLSRLKEGVGAGYHLTFYNLKLKDVEIVSKEARVHEAVLGTGYTDYEVKFRANIVPDDYDFSCKHPYWSIDTREGFFDPVYISGGTVEGTAYIEPSEDSEIIDYILDPTYDIQTLYSAGYSYSSITDKIDFISFNDDDFIDVSYDYRGYRASSYLDKAELDLPQESVDYMNDMINYARDPESYEED